MAISTHGYTHNIVSGIRENISNLPEKSTVGMAELGIVHENLVRFRLLKNAGEKETEDG